MKFLKKIGKKIVKGIKTGLKSVGKAFKKAFKGIGKFIGKLNIEENDSAKDQAVLTDEQIIENQTFELINYIIDDNTSKFDKDTLLYSWKASIIVSLISSLVITIKNRENIVFLI